MLVKVYYMSGAIETYETQSMGYKEVDAASYWTDVDGIHLGVGTVEKLKEADKQDGVPRRNSLIIPREKYPEIFTILVDGVRVWYGEPKREPKRRGKDVDCVIIDEWFREEEEHEVN